MALVGADEPVGGILVGGVGGIGVGGGFEGEALFGVCGDCLLEFGEGYAEGFEFVPLELGWGLVGLFKGEGL